MYFQKTNIKEIEQEIVTLSKKLGVPEFNPNIHYSDLDLVKYEADIRSEIAGRNVNHVTTAVVSFVVGFAVFFLGMNVEILINHLKDIQQENGFITFFVVIVLIAIVVIPMSRIFEKETRHSINIFRKRISELHRLADYIKIYRENR